MNDEPVFNVTVSEATALKDALDVLLKASFVDENVRLTETAGVSHLLRIANELVEQCACPADDCKVVTSRKWNYIIDGIAAIDFGQSRSLRTAIAIRRLQNVIDPQGGAYPPCA